MPKFTILSGTQIALLNKAYKEIFAPNKGILCVDESPSTLGLHLESLGIPNTFRMREDFRKVIYTLPSLEKYLSSVVMSPETWLHKQEDGKYFYNILKEKGLIIGMRMDKGHVEIGNCSGEYIPQGLDDLEFRCMKAQQDGVQFARFRGVINIGKNKPSDTAIDGNANVLARFAAYCQMGGILPILYADVLAIGDHDMDCCQRITEQYLAAVIKALHDYHVHLEAVVLETNMVTPGKSSITEMHETKIAIATVTSLQRTVPPAISGIVLSPGGIDGEIFAMSFNEATLYTGYKPWVLTFNFGYALQAPALMYWSSDTESTSKVQDIILDTLQIFTSATMGQHTEKIDIRLEKPCGIYFEDYYTPDEDEKSTESEEEEEEEDFQGDEKIKAAREAEMKKKKAAYFDRRLQREMKKYKKVNLKSWESRMTKRTRQRKLKA